MAKLTKKVRNFDEYIEDFMIHCVNKDLSKKTLKSYESSLKLFQKYLEEEHNIFTPTMVTAKIFKEYLEFTKTKGKYSYVANGDSTTCNNPTARNDFGKQVSMWTVNNYLRNIKVFYSYLVECKVFKVHPLAVVKSFKHSRKPKSDIKDIDFNKVIKCLDLTKFSEYRDYIIIQLLLDTGMRIGETLNLKTENILIDKKAIFIPTEINKGRRDRYVFFSTTMQIMLRRWMDYKERYFDTEYLVVTTRGSNFTVTNFEKNLKSYCIRAGLEENITCHQIRNNFAKRFLLSGGDIFILSKILGHSSVTITEQAYLDVTNEDIQKKYYKFSPLENMRK